VIVSGKDGRCVIERDSEQACLALVETLKAGLKDIEAGEERLVALAHQPHTLQRWVEHVNGHAGPQGVGDDL
jgi:hypothetical protein